jgi:DNA-directed RNA polymerase sigma subunit (sigma70/sigma32)
MRFTKAIAILANQLQEATVTGSASPEVVDEGYGVAPIVIESRVVPTGTYALRRIHYLNEIEQGMLLSAEQRQALVNLIKADDFDAKQKVIFHNLRLVAGIAMRYANRGIEFLDLVSVGIMGLIHALEKFELEGGIRFPVYARWCIRENIERAIMDRNNSQPIGAR